MAYQQVDPSLVGSGQPFSGELTEVAFIPLDQNIHCDVFIANVSTTDNTRVRLAVKNLYLPMEDRFYIVYDAEVVAQGMLIIPRLGLESETQVLAYSDNGLATFTVSGNNVINLV